MQPVAVFVSQADPRPTSDAAAVTRAEADANRDFVILACNSYDEMRAELRAAEQVAADLLSACKAALEYLTTGRGNPEVIRPRMRIAIIKAEDRKS